ncbi:hypothetical protein [Methyloversatilis sp.]|uniref:hypothetical protein n=1 Tax=Methyloversatilis sp. TaxID=2569862 RepID=UPI0027BB0795|nr:hypothetical protein [Methyloversatilis sp.]
MSDERLCSSELEAIACFGKAVCIFMEPALDGPAPAICAAAPRSHMRGSRGVMPAHLHAVSVVVAFVPEWPVI